MTATNDLETAVQCMQIGASDYLVKPVEESRLVSSVKRALEIRTLRAEVVSLKERLLTETATSGKPSPRSSPKARPCLRSFDMSRPLRCHHNRS
jgi:DNA-binding NtrC family response regulator